MDVKNKENNQDKNVDVKMQMAHIGGTLGHLNNAATVDDLANAILATVRNTDYRHQMVAKVKAVVNNSIRSRMGRLHD